MMAITISSSINVKPRRAPLAGLPVTVGYSVQPFARRERVHVEDVVARLRILRRTLVTAHSPGLLRSHGSVRKERIARQPAQEVDVDLLLAGDVLDAFVQRLEVWRVARGAQLDFDMSRLRGEFVFVDRLADVSQRRTQIGFLFPLRNELRQRHRRCREQRDDRERDHELDERKAARAHEAYGSMAMLSGGAAPLPTAAPAEPSTDTWAAMLVAGRGCSALKRSTIRPPSPCTGASGVATTSSRALPPRASTEGLAAADGTISPFVALINCSADASKRTCERRRVIASAADRCTTT